MADPPGLLRQFGIHDSLILAAGGEHLDGLRLDTRFTQNPLLRCSEALGTDTQRLLRILEFQDHAVGEAVSAESKKLKEYKCSAVGAYGVEPSHSSFDDARHT
jgi:hypothetical protein